MITTLAVSIALACLGLFCLLAAAVHGAYPQSRTTVEVYPEDVRVPRRWGQIVAFAVVGVASLVAAAWLFWVVFLPAHRLGEVEEATRATFLQRLGEVPVKIELHEDDRPRQGKWSFAGTAWTRDDTAWDVNVTWNTSAWECRASKREPGR